MSKHLNYFMVMYNLFDNLDLCTLIFLPLSKIILLKFFFIIFLFSSFNQWLNQLLNTFIILVDVFNDNIIFLLLNCVRSISNSLRFKKLRALLLLNSMLAYCASWQFLKLIPIINDFVATCPSFLQIMENRFSCMIMANPFYVLLLFIML
jgi:hypothetical protein